MANVYGVWHGGSGCGQSYDWQDALEFWHSIKEAKLSLQRREWRNWDDHCYVTIHEDGSISRKVEWINTPLVERGECYLDLFDIESGEPYKRLTLGPRGGVRSENF
jgi:hypothetical protein